MHREDMRSKQVVQNGNRQTRFLYILPMLAFILALSALFASGCGSQPDKTGIATAQQLETGNAAAQQPETGNAAAQQPETDSANPPQAEYSSLDEMSGKKIGMVTGFDTVLKDALTHENEFVYYPTATDTIVALKAGRVDAVCLDEPVARLAIHANSGICIMPQTVAQAEYGIVFPKNSPLLEPFNQVIRQFWEDGTLKALEDKWLDGEEEGKVLIQQDWEGANGTVRYYHDATYNPMCYIGKGGESAGYDLDLVLMAARELDLKVEMTICDFDALVPAIQSGKADIASGCMDITEEKKKNVDFSEPYYKSAVVLLVRDTGAASVQASFWEGLKESFASTFLEENRWKMILDGLGVTILISVLSGIFGLVLGFGLCMLRRMKNKPARWGASVFIRVVQGMPIVVFLMILFYIIFASSDISGIAVSVIGFSVNFAAYTSEMMRNGIESVDKGQSEAAFAMGYTKYQTFWKIVFPQAAVRFLPVLKGEFISMVKMTSVVGYIAVQDLTKASDIIRSHTMDAFFPLIATAVIYFTVANLMTTALTMIERQIDPKRRARKVKGVETH